jgi:hypothetical protein
MTIASLTLAGNQALGSTAIVTGTTASPGLSDNGTLYVATGAGFTLTLPALSGVFNGYRVGLRNRVSSGTCIANRSSTDTVESQGTTGLTSITLPSLSDQVWFIADATNSRWYVLGTRSFESTEISLATSTVDSQAHSLGIVPKDHRQFLRCKTAELGYSVGDEVGIEGPRDQATAQTETELVLDATNGVLLIGTIQNQRAINKTTPATQVAITAANWRYFWRAWAAN